MLQGISRFIFALSESDIVEPRSKSYGKITEIKFAIEIYYLNFASANLIQFCSGSTISAVKLSADLKSPKPTQKNNPVRGWAENTFVRQKLDTNDFSTI